MGPTGESSWKSALRFREIDNIHYVKFKSDIAALEALVSGAESRTGNAA